MRRGLALGCGGTLGFAWAAVALQSLQRELGWDARDADVLIGTSAGAEMAALLGSGHAVDDIVAALDGGGDDPVLSWLVRQHPGIRPPLPRLGRPASGLALRALRGEVDVTAGLAGLLPCGRGDATWLRELGGRLTLTHPATWLVAADAATGERVAFGAPGAPDAGLGDAIAASWAIPGWFPPVAVGGRRFLDGGTISSVSADLLLPLRLDEVVVVAPMTSERPAPARGLVRLERMLRRRMTRGLDREVALLRAAGTRVVRVEPGPDELAAMGVNFMDVRRRRATMTAARARHAG
jgi:NTE family protein